MATANLQARRTEAPIQRSRARYIPTIPPAVMMTAAQEITDILRQRGLHFAFCADIATYAYGVTRWVPRSIRIMVCLNAEESIDDLSESISALHATRMKYEPSSGVLSYDATGKLRDMDTHVHSTINVVFTPTNRHPLASSSFVVDGLPLVPFTFVLLEQLAEWATCQSGLRQQKEKAVMTMLRYFRSNLSKPYCKPIRAFDALLHEESQSRVTRFYEDKPAYSPEWKRMGFLTPFDTQASSNQADLDESEAVALGHDSVGLPQSNPNLAASLEDNLESLTTSNFPSSDQPASAPLTGSSSSEIPLEAQSISLSVKCPPRLLELLHDWDTDPGAKEGAAREIQAFLISIRMGRQTLVTGPRQILDTLVHAQVHRFFSENKAFFLQWQKLGFFEHYSSKGDVPPAPPKLDRGYFLPPTRVPHSTTKYEPDSDGKSVGKKGKIARKTARQLGFKEARTRAAETTVAALRDSGFLCAIFGSMACSLYGNPRLPNDVDVLVLLPDEPHTQEEIKSKVIDRFPDNFFLKPARDPSATYRILYYRPSADTISRNEIIKIDILLPGVMNLPSLQLWQVVIRAGLPVVPYSVLLMQKLQGWDDHRNSADDRHRKKAPDDTKDVLWLLESSDALMNTSSQLQAWSDRSLFSESFENLSRTRVNLFCVVFPASSEKWRKLGFELSNILE
ncbi:hypothetical protein DXG01_002791 [Tephrocybe rancida]|nr:hypothetical protein DXG01_002791 [Tephrocybe rancida]